MQIAILGGEIPTAPVDKMNDIIFIMQPFQLSNILSNITTLQELSMQYGLQLG